MALGLEKLSGFLSEKAQADCCRIMHFEKMSGGAIQENYALDVVFEGGLLNGSHELVLRTDAPSLVEVSHTRAQEFELLRKAYEAGVMVPEPLWVCLDPSVFERPFYIMRRVKGVAEGHILVKDEAIKTNAEGLLEHLGVQLAKIHSITPESHTFGFLAIPDPTPATAGVEFFRECLDRLPGSYPSIEWGLRWLELNAPENVILVLNHRDYRVGNLMLDNGVLTGILDWEFANWSDYHEDIGWFCARCWRFGNFSLEAGGIGSREAFYRGYTEVSGRCIDPAQVFYWEAFAHMRWAVIAIQQGERHASGGEESLHLALTGRICAELEWELLRMTDPKNKQRG